MKTEKMITEEEIVTQILDEELNGIDEETLTDEEYFDLEMKIISRILIQLTENNLIN
jgi:hypothetical protein